jgi:iron complex outermembrane receptor protein
MNPDFTGSVSTNFSYKRFSVDALFDFKIGGDISSYSGRYGTAYGLFESTLQGRDPEFGGISWNSGFTGGSYTDGVIVDGVFAPGTTVQMKNSAGETVSHNVGGMTYQEAYDKGMVEPTHSGYWTYWNNSWGTGVMNDAVLQENSYVGFRQLTLTYNIPSTLTQKVGISAANIGVYGRDLGFLYKTLKDNLHPFSVRSNRSGAAHEWQQIPYVRTFGATLNLSL